MNHDLIKHSVLCQCLCCCFSCHTT